jgi:hydroxymethylpyrimidine pyrophosphatase-like HAD family hydrolase
MRYSVIACDYDGTLASDGIADEHTLASLQRLRASGRKLILVTGRILSDLLAIFPQVDLFDRLVVENGAVLYRPTDKEEKQLAEAPPQSFFQALRQRSIPYSVGRAIVATHRPHDTAVLEIIRDLGLEHQVIFNKGAVMVLPAGVNKATGLEAALRELALSRHNVVGIGDAENDHAFLNLCESAVAVANALPSIKDRADWVTLGNQGAGVIELVDRLLADDLRSHDLRSSRHNVVIGTQDSEEVSVNLHRQNLLVAGTSGSGKSTLASALLERLAVKDYQFCVIDPEGDYENFEGAVTLGTAEHAPSLKEILDLLEQPEQNVVINLVGLPLADRPSFFSILFPQLQELRSRNGRPHWIVIDETHHLLPSSGIASEALSQMTEAMLFITVHPEEVAPSVLASVDIVIAVGSSAQETIGRFSRAINQPAPAIAGPDLKPGEVLFWARQSNAAPHKLTILPGRTERRRHQRKYAEGKLSPERSFYFRGPKGKLNLRAQNLILFVQLAEGVDDETWIYHRKNGDYSQWFRDVIRDDVLAQEVEPIEKLPKLTPSEGRRLIRALVERHYTLPA